MSLTVVQRFYELAKQQAEAPALGLAYDGQYHDLPWWFVKSKAKHFGLGLLELEAREGEYFYLLPSSHPTWIYAELGALTIGLKTLPLPAEITGDALEALFRRYPPAYFFLEAAAYSQWRPWLLRHKGLRRIVLPGDAPQLTQESQGRVTGFRKVFNAGVRSEAKYHQAYRRIRQGLEEQREMSPLRVDAGGGVEERPLRYGEVNEVCARLSQALGPAKARCLLSSPDLSRSFARIACVYWPIFAGLQTVFLPPEMTWPAALRRFRPEALFLRAGQFSTAAEISLAGRMGYFARRRLRAALGKRLRCLIAESLDEATDSAAASTIRLKVVAPAPEAANFLL